MSRKAKPKISPDQTVTTTVAAETIGVTPAWLGKLEAQGVVEKVARGRWDLVNVVQGYIRWLKDDARRSSKSAAQTRSQEIRAKREELALAKEERALIPADQVNEVMDFISSKIRSEFAGMPTSFTRDMSLRKKLETDVDARLNRIADAFEKAADVVEKGGDLFKAD